ncbi:MAG: hypothetical protein GY802_04205 [Gammaproteobacteria bacterium]|nr:hypothetical protein [Gammaproteobacteria bacterium]
MNLSSLYEITSNDKLLTSLGLAVAEAKMLRSLLKARESAVKADRGSGQLERMIHLNREIDYLEAKLLQVKSKATRALV